MISLKRQIQYICGSVTAFAISPLLYISTIPANYKLFLAGASVVSAVWLASILSKGIDKGLTSLNIGLQNFKDGEFTTSLAITGNDEIQYLCSLYNETSDKLRQEKQWIYQRELMLDKVLQNSPDVLLLVNDRQQIVFSNYQARILFNQSQKLEGLTLEHILEQQPLNFKNAVLNSSEGLFTLPLSSGEIQTWHLAKGTFFLNNQSHTLLILKQMTKELNRQEVAVWKKVIRVISHELNNSIGPISSMLHSGQLLSEQQGDMRLKRVFETIEERIAHLNQFVQNYGKFAKLPPPKPTHINWLKILERIRHQYCFTFSLGKDIELEADEVQLEQLLINLLKNAHESGTNLADVAISVSSNANNIVIEVMDKGKGMPESVMTNALIPFYSTKTDGTGLGLALCREIVDAHHGNLILQNRKTQGLSVKVVLPSQA